MGINKQLAYETELVAAHMKKESKSPLPRELFLSAAYDVYMNDPEAFAVLVKELRAKAEKKLIRKQNRVKAK